MDRASDPIATTGDDPVERREYDVLGRVKETRRQCAVCENPATKKTPHLKIWYCDDHYEKFTVATTAYENMNRRQRRAMDKLLRRKRGSTHG